MKFTEREVYIINCLAVFGIDILSKDKDLETLNSLYTKGIIFCTEVLNKDRSLDPYKVKISFWSEHFCKVKRKTCMERLADEELKNMSRGFNKLSQQYWTYTPYTGKMSDPNQFKIINDYSDEEPKVHYVMPRTPIGDYTIQKYTLDTKDKIIKLSNKCIKYYRCGSPALIVPTDSGEVDLEVGDYLIKNNKTNKLGVIKADTYNNQDKLESYFLLNLAP